MCVCRVGLCPGGVVHSVQRSVQREGELFGDADPVAVPSEEQFNLDALHRGGVSDVEQCVDDFWLVSAVEIYVLEVMPIGCDKRQCSCSTRFRCIDFVDDQAIGISFNRFPDSDVVIWEHRTA